MAIRVCKKIDSTQTCRGTRGRVSVCDVVRSYVAVRLIDNGLPGSDVHAAERGCHKARVGILWVPRGTRTQQQHSASGACMSVRPCVQSVCVSVCVRACVRAYDRQVCMRAIESWINLCRLHGRDRVARCEWRGGSDPVLKWTDEASPCRLYTPLTLKLIACAGTCMCMCACMAISLSHTCRDPDTINTQQVC
jgi:hypothetical protein